MPLAGVDARLFPLGSNRGAARDPSPRKSVPSSVLTLYLPVSRTAELEAKRDTLCLQLCRFSDSKRSHADVVEVSVSFY